MGDRPDPSRNLPQALEDKCSCSAREQYPNGKQHQPSSGKETPRLPPSPMQVSRQEESTSRFLPVREARDLPRMPEEEWSAAPSPQRLRGLTVKCSTTMEEAWEERRSLSMMTPTPMWESGPRLRGENSR